MQFIETPLKGVVIAELDRHEDRRGIFLELYHQDRYEKAGIPERFVQDNFSRSGCGVLRGLHYQRHRPQGKLVTALEGYVYDVAVDIRRGSPSFGKWFGVELSEANRRQLYVPPGFAHGYCVVSEWASILYKCTEVYLPDDEHGIIWNDPAIGIAWPVKVPVLSPKDQAYKVLAESDLPDYDG